MAEEQTLVSSHEKTLQALCTLSDIGATVNIASLIYQVQQAPDPETAVRKVLVALPLCSDVLERKWRDAIMAVWATHHPQVPLLPALSLSSDDVRATPILVDALAYLDAIAQEPALLVEENGELLVRAEDVWRLAASLPSLTGHELHQVENEWAYTSMRRLRATLQALRLIRPVKGQLVVVRSRYERFKAYPALQQFYVLWHADTYHVDWVEFAGMWGKFTRVIQDYLPLLWDLGEHLRAEQSLDRRQWVVEMLETFAPLWEEEGLLEVGSGQAAILPIVQQHALPTIMEKFVVRDMLLRHGLISVSEEFGKLSQFTWTKVGEALFTAELSQELPCGLELLSHHHTHLLPDPNPRFL